MGIIRQTACVPSVEKSLKILKLILLFLRCTTVSTSWGCTGLFSHKKSLTEMFQAKHPGVVGAGSTLWIGSMGRFVVSMGQWDSWLNQ